MKKFLLLCLAGSIAPAAFSQNISINDNGATANANAILDVDATTNDKGILIPRITSVQRNAITGLTAAEDGLMVYDETTSSFWYWNGYEWLEMSAGWEVYGNTGTNPSVNFLGTTDNVDLVFRAYNTEYMRIESGGDVGIGVNNPIMKLHISSADAADGINIDNTAANGDPILQYRVNGTSVVTMGIDDSDGDKFKIGTTAITTGTRVTIDANGYIGIGITAPIYHWHQEANRSADYVAWVENTNTGGASLAGYQAGTYNAVGGVTNNANGLGVYGVHLTATGAGIGIWGTSNSSDAVGVQGSIPTTGSWLGYGGLFMGGLGYINGAYNLSDLRAKKDVKPISGALETVLNLKGVSYQYNDDRFGYLTGSDTRTYLGFIAQEVEKILPEVTAKKYGLTGGPDHKETMIDASVLSREVVTVVDYTAIVPVLVEAIKEQQARIDEQQQQIRVLQEQIGKK